MRLLPSITCLTALALSAPSSFSAEYVSTGSGLWDLGWTNLWQLSDTSGLSGYPYTGGVDSISILTDHLITYSGAEGVGLTGTKDLGVANGQTISIDGGILTQSSPGSHIRIGQETTGTVKINDGRWHFTDSAGTNNGDMHVGALGGTGIIHIGDGLGAPQSAVLNLRDRVDGSLNGGAKSMNLGSTLGSRAGVGIMVIHSDGLFEGDVRNGTSDNPVVRIGQSAVDSPAQSSITVLSGGLFRLHGSVEVGSRGDATARSNGLIHLNGGTMEMDAGELNIGWDGNGDFLVENNGALNRNVTATKYDLYVGRDSDGVGNITLQSGGRFIRGAGNKQGDFNLGLNGTANLTINDGGVFQNDSTNFDWVGKEVGGKGTVTINEGGTYLATAGTSLSVGFNVGATGTIHVNGGTLDLQGTSGSLILGTDGTATLRQTSGYSNVNTVTIGELSGEGTFELLDGTFVTRGAFRLGGARTTSLGTGSGIGFQSGGELTIGSAFTIGLGVGHFGTYTMTGGVLYHQASDLTVGESGTGKLIIGSDAVLDSTSTGSLLVGRNDGSSGEMYVDGVLKRNYSTNPIRVGDGTREGTPSDAVGILGGDGIIEATSSGVRIGALGTLTGGTVGTIGSLEIQGSLSVSAGGKLNVDLNSSGEGDRINLLGALDLTDAVLGGTWSGGAPTFGQTFWLITNDDADEIIGRFANVTLDGSYQGLFPDAEGSVMVGGHEFAVFYHADFENTAFMGGNDLALRAVPEPSAALLLGGAALLSLARRRRGSRVTSGEGRELGCVRASAS